VGEQEDRVRPRTPARRERSVTIILGSRDGEKGLKAAEGLSGNVIARQLNVADGESVARLKGSVEDEFERLNMLVRNAGFANDGGQRGVGADLDRAREELEANLLGAGACARRSSVAGLPTGSARRC
jgi:NAD(P)-dependent dehydrogenase (short-subunit alcohol dehydrogenase family)